MRTQIAAGMFVIAVGCGVDSPPPVDPFARFDLASAFSTTDVTPIGLAITPDGTRYVFDEVFGLYRLDGASAIEVVSMSNMPDPGPTAVVKPPFTDVVAIGANQFAVTAIGDGYILDTQAMTLTQRFCYLPGDDGTGVPLAIVQRTDALTFDPILDKFYAQPVTRDVAGTFVRSEIAQYDRATGVDQFWTTAPDSLAATGMIKLGEELVVAQGSRMMVGDPTHAGRIGTLLDDLERFGVQSIDGIALDPITGALVIVDKASNTMVDIDRATLDF